MLISRCVCGADHFPDRVERNGLAIALCRCGVQHLVSELTPEAYEAQYRGDYHRAVDRHPGCIPYRQRYEHDRMVAGARYRRYREILSAPFSDVVTALDVGAANGAFVDCLREVGVDAFGIDPDPAMARDTIATGTTRDVHREFDLVTFHDVLEHTLAPGDELAQALRLCAPRAFVVVDVPDVSTVAGHHHFKAEHPWYFDSSALHRLATAAGFEFLNLDYPLPGKMVAYLRAP